MCNCPAVRLAERLAHFTGQAFAHLGGASQQLVGHLVQGVGPVQRAQRPPAPLRCTGRRHRPVDLVRRGLAEEAGGLPGGRVDEIASGPGAGLVAAFQVVLAGQCLHALLGGGHRAS
jgi:hypothetical protein